jgi:phytoene dehydrogenase-like protein
MGGLLAAQRLVRLGFRVCVVEARPDAGGLAASFECDGFVFDAGPYVLLDRPGLEWAFRAVGLELTEHLALRRIDPIYEVSAPEGVTVRFCASLDETAAGFEQTWPGSGLRYVRFVQSMERIYRRLSPLLHVSRPGPFDLLRKGAWRHLPFLLRSLHSVLRGTGLPAPVQEALAIWTHVAGQRVADAPSPLAFVPALMHTVGAYYPAEGIGAIPRQLAALAQTSGVEFRYGSTVHAIRCEHGRVRGVETAQGEFLAADAVVANTGGLGTYLELMDSTPPAVADRLRRLPLQSPGVCAYLAVRGQMRPPYLRFFLPGGGELCRLLIMPGVMVPQLQRDGWWPARLLGPMDYGRAQRDGPAGQRAYLDSMLAEKWWRQHVSEVRVLATRIPADWGKEFHLYRDSMNPVMTAQFMRAGRLAHRSPWLRGLYLAGSSTHPGQWVSFCAISGVLAADRLREDLR